MLKLEASDKQITSANANGKIMAPVHVLGTTVTTITAKDEDDSEGPYGQIEYSLLPSKGSENFIILPRTGEIQTALSLDREKAESYELNIQVKHFQSRKMDHVLSILKRY